MTLERELRHRRRYYTVKKLRLLEYLHKCGFKEVMTVPEPTNEDYKWFVFYNTPELEDAVDAYFNQSKAAGPEQSLGTRS